MPNRTQNDVRATTSYSCPNCTQLIRVPDRLVGRPVRCPKCRGDFRPMISGGAHDNSGQTDAARWSTQLETDSGRVGFRVLAISLAIILVACCGGGLLLIQNRRVEAESLQTQSRSSSSGNAQTSIPLPPAKPIVAIEAKSEVSGSEIEKWTHRELIDFLAKRGTKLDAFAAVGSDKGPAMWLIYDPTRKRIGLVQYGDRVVASMVGAGQIIGVLVQKWPTVEEARDQAGATKTGYSFGRFTFLGNPSLTEYIRAAIENRKLPQVDEAGKTALEQMLGGINVPPDGGK
jgi:hypothetical protein